MQIKKYSLQFLDNNSTKKCAFLEIKLYIKFHLYVIKCLLDVYG